ncbi:uncharacterized protein FPRN_07242 [Fusarium proliferatum]|nr:uncharacterized protein FPRN_07242 [Fusarium proliferatum]
MTEMDLTFICGQRTSSLLGGPFAASLFRTTYAKHRGRGPMVIPAALPLDIPAIEEETLCLEIRLNGDGCSVLLETRSLGVVHAGLQAKPTKDPKKNPFSLRYRVTRPRLLFLWKGQGDVLKHTVSFAIYPEGVVLTPNHVPMVIGPQLSSFRPDFASHQPAWSWAPIEHIRSILVHEQDGRGFIGMMIHYDNGSQRFIGDFARADDYDDDIRYPISIEPIKHITMLVLKPYRSSGESFFAVSTPAWAITRNNKTQAEKLDALHIYMGGVGLQLRDSNLFFNNSLLCYEVP